MNPFPASDTGSVAQVQGAFADLVCADPDLTRAEFDAIIEANWGCAEPPAVADDNDVADEPMSNTPVRSLSPDSSVHASVGPPDASGLARLRSPPDRAPCPQP